MEDNRHIEMVLLKKRIKEYKIVNCQQIEIQFIEYFNKVSVNIFEEDKLHVWFHDEKYTGNFTISAGQTDEFIEKMIDDSRGDFLYSNVQWTYNSDNDKGKNSNMTDEKFEKLDIYKNIEWIKSVILKIRNKVTFDFNTSYIVKYRIFKLKDNLVCDMQYRRSSELLCVENISFKKNARLHNVFVGDLIEDVLLDSLNMEERVLSTTSMSLKKGKFVIASKAMAQLLNEYILTFYADNIYFEKSNINTHCIQNKIINRNMDLEVLPYKNIRFDGEGSIIKEEIILKSGVLKNLLGNNKFSYYLKINNIGYADLCMPSRIKHQRIKFKIDNVESNKITDENCIICLFQNLFFDCSKREIKGIAICKSNKGNFKVNFQENIDDILGHVYQITKERIWNDNVYCSDMVIDHSTL